MSNALKNILARLSGHGPAEARKLLASQWGFLEPGEYQLAIEAIEAAEQD